MVRWSHTIRITLHFYVVFECKYVCQLIITTFKWISTFMTCVGDKGNRKKLIEREYMHPKKYRYYTIFIHCILNEQRSDDLKLPLNTITLSQRLNRYTKTSVIILIVTAIQNTTTMHKAIYSDMFSSYTSIRICC